MGPYIALVGPLVGPYIALVGPLVGPYIALVGPLLGPYIALVGPLVGPFFKVQGSRFFIIRHIHNHTSIISSEMQVELKNNTAFT